MSERKLIRRALVSVYDKARLIEIGKVLSDAGVEILSTGSTAKNLAGAGIKVTEADRFVYYFKFLGELWMIKVQDLKKLIDENNFRIGVGGDPGSNSSGYLIPRNKFRDKFLVRINLF